MMIWWGEFSATTILTILRNFAPIIHFVSKRTVVESLISISFQRYIGKNLKIEPGCRQATILTRLLIHHRVSSIELDFKTQSRIGCPGTSPIAVDPLNLTLKGPRLARRPLQVPTKP